MEQQSSNSLQAAGGAIRYLVKTGRVRLGVCADPTFGRGCRILRPFYSGLHPLIATHGLGYSWISARTRRLGEVGFVVMGIADFIERSNAAQSPDEAVSLFEQATSSYGFTKIAYASLTSGAHNRREAPGFLVSYPHDWVGFYFERGYERIDPSTQHLLTARSSFVWDDLPHLRNLNRQQKRVMREAEDAGLRSGVSVPLHGPFGETCAIALASDAADANATAHQHSLQALAVQFHTVYSALHPDPTPAPAPILLTPRERECLQWSANGKSSWEIGMILGISEHGVGFHLRNAMAKLETTTRIAAVVKAIRLGLIVL